MAVSVGVGVEVGNRVAVGDAIGVEVAKGNSTVEIGNVCSPIA